MFWDNPQMIINHIRHSCVTSDSTGMCEMVIVQDEEDIFKTNLRQFHVNDNEDSSPFGQSYDIPMSPIDYSPTPKYHRGGEKVKKPQKNVKCKNIHYPGDSEMIKLTDEVREELFFDDNPPTVAQAPVTKSLLSKQLQEAHKAKSNPFLSYATADGEGLGDTCRTHSVYIYITFLTSEAERFQALHIEYLLTATVKDVIGLVLYKVLLEGRRCHVQTDVKHYELHMADDDGLPELEFQALEENRKMSDYEFTHLALVEKRKPVSSKSISPTSSSSKHSVSVKINLPQNTMVNYSMIKVDSKDVKMKVIHNKLVKNKRVPKKNGHGYHLEHPNEQGVPVDLDATLESMGVVEFNFVKDVPDSVDRGRGNDEKVDEFMSLQYKSYVVTLLQKVLAPEVQLGIHGQKIEIDPVPANVKMQKFWRKQKPISLAVNLIADCETLEAKPGNRCTFRIVYKKNDDFTSLDFESSMEVAKEIETKILNILKSRPHTRSARNEYLLSREPRKPGSLEKMRKRTQTAKSV